MNKPNCWPVCFLLSCFLYVCYLGCGIRTLRKKLELFFHSFILHLLIFVIVIFTRFFYNCSRIPQQFPRKQTKECYKRCLVLPVQDTQWFRYFQPGALARKKTIARVIVPEEQNQLSGIRTRSWSHQVISSAHRNRLLRSQLK